MVKSTSLRNDCVMFKAYHTGQSTTGRATKRKYSRDDNRVVIKFYFASRPNKTGYRLRMQRA